MRAAERSASKYTPLNITADRVQASPVSRASARGSTGNNARENHGRSLQPKDTVPPTGLQTLQNEAHAQIFGRKAGPVATNALDSSSTGKNSRYYRTKNPIVMNHIANQSPAANRTGQLAAETLNPQSHHVKHKSLREHRESSQVQQAEKNK